MSYQEKLKRIATVLLIVFAITGLSMCLASIAGSWVILIIGLSLIALAILLLMYVISLSKAKKEKPQKYSTNIAHHKNHAKATLGKYPHLENICDFLVSHVAVSTFKAFYLPSEIIVRLTDELKAKCPTIRSIYLIVSYLAQTLNTKMPEVTIDFRSSKAAGLYEFNGSFQRIRLIYDPIMTANDIIRVLLHEMAHAYLYQRGVVLSPTLANEYMTDICSILFNCKNVGVRDFAMRIIPASYGYSSYKLGYLNNHELQYCLRYLARLTDDHTLITR